MRNYTIKDNVTLKYKDKEFKFPMVLLSLLSLAKRRVDLKLDNVWLVSGAVGSGKSTIAKGIAGVYQMLFDRELDLENFTWRSEGVIEFTDNTKNETQVIVQDEGIVGMTGRDSLTRAGHQLKVTLVTKRRMRIFYIILIDELQEYNQKIINRATLLIDTRFIMNKGDPTRGYFKIYSQKELKECYWLLKEKKIKSIGDYNGAIKPFFRFYNYEDVFINEEEYEQKKIEETNQSNEDNKVTWSKEKMKAFYLWGATSKKMMDIADIVGVHRNTVSTWVRDFKKYAHK